MRILIKMPDFYGRHEGRFASYLKDYFDKIVEIYFPPDKLRDPYDEKVMFDYTLGVAKACEPYLKSGNILFFIDAWNMAVPLLVQKAKLTNQNVKFAGLVHVLPGFNSFLSPLLFLEKSLFSCFDLLLCGSYVVEKYLKSILLDVPNVRIEYVPFPIKIPCDIDKTHSFSKIKRDETKIAFPFNINDPDRCFSEALEIVSYLNSFSFLKKNRTQPFILTVLSPREYEDSYPIEDYPFLEFRICKNDVDYFRALHECKFVLTCSKVETAGLAIKEAIFSGCIPLVVNTGIKTLKTSYKEFINEEYFISKEELPQKIFSLTPVSLLRGFFIKEFFRPRFFADIVKKYLSQL